MPPLVPGQEVCTREPAYLPALGRWPRFLRPASELQDTQKGRALLFPRALWLASLFVLAPVAAPGPLPANAILRSSSPVCTRIATALHSSARPVRLPPVRSARPVQSAGSAAPAPTVPTTALAALR